MAPEVLNCPFKNRPDENKENSALHYSFHVDAVRRACLPCTGGSQCWGLAPGLPFQLCCFALTGNEVCIILRAGGNVHAV
jgi:hypothetical protein